MGIMYRIMGQGSQGGEAEGATMGCFVKIHE